MGRSLRFLATFAAIIVVFGACTGGGTPPGSSAQTGAGGKPAYGGTVTFVLENDVVDFDPLRSRAFVDRNAHYQIFDSLVRVDAAGKLIPWLALSWETSSDGKQVTFKLRQDVKYHDGTPFDAESVKWNIDRYRTLAARERSRARRRRRGQGPVHGELQPQVAVRAAPRDTGGSRRDDALAQGRRGRRSGLHAQAGGCRLGSVQVR